jgi:hypothetical protein
MGDETIWKFVLKPVDEQTVEMPSHARVLSAKEQDGEICVWALVNPNDYKTQRMFRVVGTGHTSERLDLWQFVDTVMLAGGALVFHVFTRP